MDKPKAKPKRKVRKLAETENSEMENAPNELVRKLTPKLWQFIFDLILNSYTEDQSMIRNQAVAGLRTVCKYFRDVVDAHISYVPEITNAFLRKNYNLGHVRVNKCLVSRLVSPIKPNQMPVFFNPNMISEIVFRPLVTKQNFVVLADHFGKLGSVQQVKIQQGFWFVCEDFEPTQEKESILAKFWENVERLELNVPCIDLLAESWRRNRNMMDVLNTAYLPKLTSFRVSGYWNRMNSFLLRSFLSSHRSTLKNVCVRLEPFEAYFARPHFRKLTEIENELLDAQDFSLNANERTELNRIVLEGGKVSEFLDKTCMSKILALMRSAQLNLETFCEPLLVDQTVKEPLSLDDFLALIEFNMATLTSLELVMNFSETVDFRVFQQMNQLETLKLQKIDDGRVSTIINLTSLPVSLKKMTLTGFSLVDSEVEQLTERMAHHKT